MMHYCHTRGTAERLFHFLLCMPSPPAWEKNPHDTSCSAKKNSWSDKIEQESIWGKKRYHLLLWKRMEMSQFWKGNNKWVINNTHLEGLTTMFLLWHWSHKSFVTLLPAYNKIMSSQLERRQGGGCDPKLKKSQEFEELTANILSLFWTMAQQLQQQQASMRNCTQSKIKKKKNPLQTSLLWSWTLLQKISNWEIISED